MNRRRADPSSGHYIVERIVNEHGPLTKEAIYKRAGNIAGSSLHAAMGYGLILRKDELYFPHLSKLAKTMLTSRWEFCYE